jgi:prepilin-type N-terminal cleavage/methylation domain-containing protein
MNLTRYQPRKKRCLQQRSGFTLIELMVVITIIIILLTMTLLAVNFSQESDRVVSATQQVKSFLEGARDRAIYAKEPRGVRFFVSPENPRAVTTMAYIAPGGTWSSPDNSVNIDLLRVDGNSDTRFDDVADTVRRVVGRNNPGWWNLKRRGWLVDGLRIRIPKGPTGTWYPLDTSLINTAAAPSDVQTLLLQVPYADAGNLGQELAHRDLSYEIELPAKILPIDPAILPQNVSINLDASKVPSAWRPLPGIEQFSGFMDVVFSPRGNVIGDAAGAGLLHLYVGDSEDSEFLLDRFRAKLKEYGTAPSGPYPQEEFFLTNVGVDSQHAFVPMDEIDASGTTMVNWTGASSTYLLKDRRYVSIFSQTGNVIVQRVNAFTGAADVADPFDIDNDADRSEPDGLADDPYAFAESGRVAN